jgi:hypothetical protein
MSVVPFRHLYASGQLRPVLDKKGSTSWPLQNTRANLLTKSAARFGRTSRHQGGCPFQRSHPDAIPNPFTSKQSARYGILIRSAALAARLLSPPWEALAPLAQISSYSRALGLVTCGWGKARGPHATSLPLIQKCSFNNSAPGKIVQPQKTACPRCSLLRTLRLVLSVAQRPIDAPRTTRGGGKSGRRTRITSLPAPPRTQTSAVRADIMDPSRGSADTTRHTDAPRAPTLSTS